MRVPRPASLVRRVMWTLALATVTSFVVVSVYIAYAELRYGSGLIDRGLDAYAQAAAQALERVTEERDAKQIAAALNFLSTHPASAEINIPAHVSVFRQGGAVVFTPPGALAFDHTTLEPGISERRVMDKMVRLFVHDAGLWRVVLINELHPRERTFLRFLFFDLIEYFLIIFPILLLPVWLAVRAGLSPLRRLSDDVAARQPGDLQTLLAPSAYEELSPLVRALNDLLQRLSHSLAREKAFVQDAAHEMRTPLAVISTQAHILVGADSNAQAQAHRRLDDAVERVSHLTHQLLRLAQMDTRDESMRHVIDIMAVVRDSVADVVTRVTRTQETKTDISLAGPDTCVVRTDPHAVQSILENLLDNALRYAGKAAVIEVAVEATPQAVSISVADDGPGIAESERSAVFERFRRGATVTSPGAGLGLAIVAQAAQSLGGRLELSKGLGDRGCRFTVRLPIGA